MVTNNYCCCCCCLINNKPSAGPYGMRSTNTIRNLLYTQKIAVNMESLTGMVFIRSNYHNLFCSIFDVLYDRVGFIYDNFMWVYWTIPTTAEPFIGHYDKFNSVDCKIMYAKANDKLNHTIFLNALSESSYEITDFFTQLSSGPYGISTINTIFLAIQCNNINHDRVNIQYDKFYPPKLYTDDIKNKYKTITPCDDLLCYVMSQQNIIKEKTALIKNKYSELTILVKNLLITISNGRIDYGDVTKLKNTIEYLTHDEGFDEKVVKVGKGDKVVENEKINKDDKYVIKEKAAKGDKVLKNETLAKAKKVVENEKINLTAADTDKIIILVNDLSIENIIKEFRSTIAKMSDYGINKPYINFEDFLTVSNKILTLFSLNPVPNISKSTYSHIIATINPKNLPSTISLKDNIDIPLSGQNIDKLNIDDLIYLLQIMDSTDISDDRFDDLRALITSRLYLLREGLAAGQ